MNRPPMPTKFLIDGVDRLGKSTLIARILDDLGYHLVIHYDKPKVLDHHLQIARAMKEAGDPTGLGDLEHLQLTDENLARFLYQEQCNTDMFQLIKSSANIVFDRTHLGEMVYAPLYRKYNGEYVYTKERFMVKKKPNVETDVRLILLVTSNFDIVTDDGLGFDFSKKEEEQQRFIEAFNLSSIPNKVVVDVHNGEGGYRSYVDVFQEAIFKPASKELVHLKMVKS